MWRDLEPELATLTVRRQRVVEDPSSRVREKPPKSHNRTPSLLLDAATLEALIDIRPWSETGLVSGYMLTGRGGQPSRPDNVTRRFNRLAVAAGVRPIGPHQVRHLLASSLLDTGYGIPEVAERLGHDAGTLMRYYSRVNAVRRRQAADYIVELVAPAEGVTRRDAALAPLTSGVGSGASTSGDRGRRDTQPGRLSSGRWSRLVSLAAFAPGRLDGGGLRPPPSGGVRGRGRV